MANPAPAPAGGNDGGNGNLADFGVYFDPTDAELLGFSTNKILSRHEYFQDLIPTANVIWN